MNESNRRSGKRAAFAIASLYLVASVNIALARDPQPSSHFAESNSLGEKSRQEHPFYVSPKIGYQYASSHLFEVGVETLYAVAVPVDVGFSLYVAPGSAMQLYTLAVMAKFRVIPGVSNFSIYARLGAALASIPGVTVAGFSISPGTTGIVGWANAGVSYDHPFSERWGVSANLGAGLAVGTSSAFALSTEVGVFFRF